MTWRSTNRLPQALTRVHNVAMATALDTAVKTAEFAKEAVTNAVGRGEHWPSQPNRSSAPYETPVYQFGDLVRGIHAAPVLLDPPTAEVTVDYDTGVWALETGTPTAAPRPFMTEATYHALDDLLQNGAGSISAQLGAPL
jgi:hypothetical protein